MLGGPADAPEAAGLIREEGTLSLIEDEDVAARSGAKRVRCGAAVWSGAAVRSSGHRSEH